jgi:hypothetical protein
MNSNWVIGFADYWIVGLLDLIHESRPPFRRFVSLYSPRAWQRVSRAAGWLRLQRYPGAQSTNPPIHQSIQSIQSINPSIRQPAPLVPNPKSIIQNPPDGLAS